MLTANVTQPLPTAPPPTARNRARPSDRRIRRSWWLFAGSFTALGFVVALRFLDGAQPVDLVAVALVVLSGVAAVVHRAAVRTLEAGRRAEAESFARILSGLSRSVSPDAIVEAIVEELGSSAGADHVVVVRRRTDARVLEATLVTRRRGVPSSTTVLPISDLEEAVGYADDREPVAIPINAGAGGSIRQGAEVRRRRPSVRVDGRADGRAGGEGDGRGEIVGVEAVDADSPIVERLAWRVRRVYGLGNTLAAPLRSDGTLVGAIVLSRRVSGPWPGASRRLVANAAAEASAALARAYSHRAAQTLASTDPLTGLPNRRYFDEVCSLLARRRRANDRVGILMVDIDRFKALNDTHGHAVGDQVLRAVGGAIAGAVREDDVPARYGGEEFVVLLRDPSPGVALEVGERVRVAVASLDLRPAGVPAVSVSVGVSVATMPDHPIGELLREADRALYEAKRRGRDRVVAA